MGYHILARGNNSCDSSNDRSPVRRNLSLIETHLDHRQEKTVSLLATHLLPLYQQAACPIMFFRGSERAKKNLDELKDRKIDEEVLEDVAGGALQDYTNDIKTSYEFVSRSNSKGYKGGLSDIKK